MSRPEPRPPAEGTLRLAVSGLVLPLGESPEKLLRIASERLKVEPTRIRRWAVLRRSLDARGHGRPRWIYRLGLEVDIDTPLPDLPGLVPWPDVSVSLTAPASPPCPRPLIVGSGPAGLFAALRCLAYGMKPLILERGAPVDERIRDVARYWRHGILDPESNVQFGEGGAGTFSDGKLTYRGKDFRRAWVFEQLVALGAPEEILFDARPHLGTDRLRAMLRRLRKTIQDGGGEVRFRTRVEGLALREDRVVGLETTRGPVEGSPVFLAAGHSARDLNTRLIQEGVDAACKGFAIGLRVELMQDAVDRWQYGPWVAHPELPRAEFHIKAGTQSGRGVYSFCMCPGGVIIPSGSERDGFVVNGMSASGRTGRWANAALVVAVHPADFGGNPVEGYRFQRTWERRALRLGGAQGVPAQRVVDFVTRRPSSSLPRSSCPWKPVVADLAESLPEFAVQCLREAMPQLIRKLKPLETGVLFAAETRTSSPVRLVRGESLESTSHPGLFPIGEGAGYAGGIVSAAIDGARAVDAYARTLGGGPDVAGSGRLVS